MDGTLFDSSATVPAAYAAAIHELCGRECTHDEVIAAYSAGPAIALIGQFVGRPGTHSDVECWLRHLRSRLSLTVVYGGILEAIGALKADGFRLAVFTGATRSAAEMQLQHAGLGDFIEVLVGSDEIDEVKPAPDGIHSLAIGSESALSIPPTSVTPSTTCDVHELQARSRSRPDGATSSRLTPTGTSSRENPATCSPF
jgi:beta-phosphoglucomutase-like phosphatase (HAD superfamily)